MTQVKTVVPTSSRLGKLGPIITRRCGEPDPDTDTDTDTDTDPCDDSNPLPNGKLIKKQKIMSCNGRLPVELEYDILSRLPAEELQCCCKYVCERWSHEINSQQFINSHISRIFSNVQVKNTSFSIMFLNSKRNRDLFSIDFGSKKVKMPTYYHLPLKKSRPQLIGSCNGLLCFDCYASDTRKRCYSLYNPVTGTFKLVPRLPNGKGRIQSGFGYDSLNNDYKILCIQGLQSFVYSLRNDSWKVIEPAAYLDFVNIDTLKTSSMVLANNSLYYTISWVQNRVETKLIIGFDLEAEFFYTVSLPFGEQDFKHSGRHDWYLAPITGCLHLVSSIIYNDSSRPCQSEILVMKEGGVWSKLICFSTATQVALSDLDCDSTYIKPYAYSEDGREMLIGIGLTNQVFVSLDLHTQEFKKHEFFGVPIDWAWFYKSVSWVGSFVSSVPLTN